MYDFVRLGTHTINDTRPEMYVGPSSNLVAFADATGRNTCRHHIRRSFLCMRRGCSFDARLWGRRPGGRRSVVGRLGHPFFFGRRPSFFDILACSSTLLYSPLRRTRARRCSNSLFCILSRVVVPLISFHPHPTMSSCQPGNRPPASQR